MREWGRRTAAAPAVRSSRKELRSLGLALGTPADSTRPLLSGARNAWVRRLSHGLAFAAVAALLPVTTVVLVQDYGMNGALAGAFATAQTAPLLLAVSRPVQAWWVIFTADIVAAVALGADFTLIGRAYLYGLMAGGRRGVDRTIAILRTALNGALPAAGPGVQTMVAADAAVQQAASRLHGRASVSVPWWRSWAARARTQPPSAPVGRRRARSRWLWGEADDS